MTLQQLTEYNAELQKQSIRIETLTDVVDMLNRLLEEHFLSCPPPHTMERTSHFLDATCVGLKEMLRDSQRKSQAIALLALEPPTNGAAHA